MQQSLFSTPPPFRFFASVLSLVFIVYGGEDVLGVFILEFRTLIAVGYTFLKSSSLSIFCQ